MERIALCVGMEMEVCYMMYSGPDKLLNSVEMRESFKGAKVGQWFRVSTNLRKGRQFFESIESEPQTRIWQNKDENMIQIQLPIFFLPSTENAKLPNIKMCYSPLLVANSLPVVNCVYSEHILIKPWVQYEAFLTLREWDTGVPRWNLQSLGDIVMEGGKFISKNESAFRLLSLANHREFGFVLKLFTDYRMALILCLQDGHLAIAVDGAAQNYSVGDYVKFLCREVDCPVHPSITSSKLFVVAADLYNEANLPLDDLSFLPLTFLETEKLFELRFPITNSLVCSPDRGSIRVENFGVLLDPDGKLSSQLFHSRIDQLIIVQARLCLVPERHSPLWYIVKVIGEDKAVKEEGELTDEQSSDCTNDDDQNDLRSVENLKQKNGSGTKLGSEAADNELDIIDGGFGAGLKRLENKLPKADVKPSGNCVGESLNASLGALSLNSNESIHSGGENLPKSDGIALFIHIKSYEWILALFDKQARKFTNWCCTLIKHLPLGNGQRSPIAGSWFRVTYAFYDTHRIRRAQKHILIYSMSSVQSAELPININPDNKEVWTMVINGKFDCINAMRAEAMTRINKPIPVTNVFSRAN